MNTSNTPSETSEAEPIIVDVRDPDDALPAPPGDALPGQLKSVELNVRLLDENDRLAADNRRLFAEMGLCVINFVSSPGAGKTTLLQHTLAALDGKRKCAVLVGDLETANDGRRLRRPGVPVAQITTGGCCHLDAGMIRRGVEALPLEGVQLLFIENVGNLVCPASFDLGENRRVTLVSCTEGEDKPLKYPPMFSSAHAVIVSKTDVAAVMEFDLEESRAAVRRAAPQAATFELSSKTGAGMDAWIEYLLALC